MAVAWTPDHTVDAQLATRLVTSLWPDLTGLEPEHVGSGWDNDMWAFGEWYFRFPRRSVAVQWFDVEMTVLPNLASVLPVAVPNPERFGEPAFGYPCRFAGYRRLPGITADRMILGRRARSKVAEDLALFLYVLHQHGPAAGRALGAPDDDFRAKFDLARERSWARLGRLGEVPPRQLSAIQDALDAMPPDSDCGKCLLHGDLYSRHLLVQDDELVGVIDWGDTCVGDPAIDLAVVFTLLEPPARAAFWRQYGRVSAVTRMRARYRALNHTIALLAYAHDTDDRPLYAEGRRAMNHLLA